MDVLKKWNEKDIRCAKNVLRTFKMMKFSQDFYGYELEPMYECIRWLQDLIIVMENPPKEFVPQLDENTKAPAGVIASVDSTAGTIGG